MNDYRVDGSLAMLSTLLSHYEGQLAPDLPRLLIAAAALVLLSRWCQDRPFIDPLCGSGTLPIEAALIGLNLAPGANRSFAAEKWPAVPASLWKKAREEAADLARRDRPVRTLGSDIDGGVLGLARYHARQAGVAENVFFQKLPAAELRSAQKYGYLICNPPYGERLGDRSQVERLYREMGAAFRELDTWSYYVLTAHPDFERLFGRRADKKRKLYNGRIQCNYYQFFGPRPPRRDVQ